MEVIISFERILDGSKYDQIHLINLAEKHFEHFNTIKKKNNQIEVFQRCLFIEITINSIRVPSGQPKPEKPEKRNHFQKKSRKNLERFRKIGKGVASQGKVGISFKEQFFCNLYFEL